MRLFSMRLAAALLMVALQLSGARLQVMRGRFRTQAVPGDEPSSWGAHDDPVAYNPWAPLPVVPGLGNLYPSAPFERLSNSWGNLLTGAAPLSPVESVDAGYRSEEVKRQLPPDWLPPYSDPRAFPADGTSDGQEADTPMVPLADKEWVGAADKLRHFAWGPSENYPLEAPMDKLPNGPLVVAAEDKVPGDFARYLEQVHVGIKSGERAQRTGTMVSRTDTDRNGMITYEEYRNETEGRQNKSDVESERLWSKYHTSNYKDMTRGEYERLVRAGFDLGGIARNDVSSEIVLSSGIHGRGFWGSGAACSSGKYITGLRLKVALNSDNRDNTGLNRVGFRCGGKGGEERETAEGPDGEWSAWADCPEGQQVFSVRVRTHGYSPGQDNTGINDLEVGCRSSDLSAHSCIRFGHKLRASKNVVVAESPVARGGGWMQKMRCSPAAAMCGIRANVVRDQGEGGDNLGIANLKVYCCSAPIDCSKLCSKKATHRDRQGGNTSNTTSSSSSSSSESVAALKCRVCRQAASAG